jgi:Protein prenyltransferase, alpha subunit
MHGRKKRGIQISEEERIKKNEQAAKIGQMISDFLAFRKDITKITDPLEYTAVMVKICPEINTIYNLRREIIEKTLGTLQPKDRYNFLLKELKLLLPLMQSNPKSYCLWHHR